MPVRSHNKNLKHMSPRPKRILCVLGMHRSGTSCLTGSLQQGGLFLGKHHTWNEYNRKGNRENQDVVNLHEAIFKANGLDWKHPLRPSSPPRTCRLLGCTGRLWRWHSREGSS